MRIHNSASGDRTRDGVNAQGWTAAQLFNVLNSGLTQISSWFKLRKFTNFGGKTRNSLVKQFDSALCYSFYSVNNDD